MLKLTTWRILCPLILVGNVTHMHFAILFRQFERPVINWCPCCAVQNNRFMPLYWHFIGHECFFLIPEFSRLFLSRPGCASFHPQPAFNKWVAKFYKYNQYLKKFIMSERDSLIKDRCGPRITNKRILLICQTIAMHHCISISISHPFIFVEG